jgi:hypothetical protein
MPSCTEIEALDLLHQSQQDIPLIRKGAFDCLDKNRLNRLPRAIALADEEKTRGEEQNHAEKVLRHSEAHYHALVENHAMMLDVVGTRLGMMQSLVGDSTPEITPEIYLHSVPKEQRRAAESVSSRMR